MGSGKWYPATCQDLVEIFHQKGEKEGAQRAVLQRRGKRQV
jgi:hypothetical protein